MSNYAEYLIDRYKGKGALVDTNLLLLLLIGSFDRSLLNINGFKRVSQYTEEDFAALTLVLKYFRMAVTTPHILTEVSNLAGQLQGERKAACFGVFLATFRHFLELAQSSYSAASRPEFPRLGLTDCVIADAASQYLVITDDLRLCASLEAAGLEALNFNHIRTIAWRT